MTRQLLPVCYRRLGYTALASLVLTFPAFAQSVWTGSTSNEFSDERNWTPDLPGVSDTGSVSSGSPQVTSDVTINRFGVDAGNVTISNTGTLTVMDGTTITGGSVGINAGGVLNSDVDLDGGDLFVDGALNGGLMLNAGDVVVNGTLGSALIGTATSLSNNGTVTDVSVSTGGTYTNNSGATTTSLTNAGTASNAGTLGSLANRAGAFTNNTGGIITGNTTVSGGTVTNNFVVTDADVAAAASFVNNHGATAQNVRNSGTVSNAGTIASVQNDAGDFTNNFGGRITGNTIVSGGTLTNNFVVSDADVAAAAAFVNNSGASAGVIRNSGTVVNAGNVAAVQNSAGQFINNSGGTVTGVTQITGGEVVNNATLSDIEIGTAGIFRNNGGATAGAVTNAGLAANDGTIASLVNSGGSFSNTGTISGAATITGGEFVNQGNVAGTIDVFDGGILSGSGMSSGLVLNSGGMLSPGPGIQAIAVNGDLTFRPGSTYQLDVDANGLSDRADVSGMLAINGGILDIRSASDQYGLSTDYTILTAGSIVGKFDEVTSNFAFLSPTLNYGSTRVDMRLGRNNVGFEEIALTANDRVTAETIENLGAANPLFSAILPLDIRTAESAFSQLNGETHASLKSALLWDSQFAREAVVDRSRSLEHQQFMQSDGVSFWTTGVLAQSRFSSNAVSQGIDNRVAGSIFGADVAVSGHWRIGGVAGYEHLSPQNQTSADSYYGGIYAAGDIGPLNILGGAIYSHSEISTRRNVAFGTYADRLSADYDSATTQIFGDFSWTLDTGRLSLEPFVNFAYLKLDTDDFTEHGGAAALSVTNRAIDVAVSTFGMRWSADLQFSDFPVVVSGMLGWRHAIGDLTPISLFTFAGSSPFVLEGVTVPQDAAIVKAGIMAELSKSARLSLSYSGVFADGFQSNAGHANLSVNF